MYYILKIQLLILILILSAYIDNYEKKIVIILPYTIIPIPQHYHPKLSYKCNVCALIIFAH